MSETNETGSVPGTGFPEEGTPAQQLKFLLRYAVMAPSSHNSQPWLFRIQDDVVELYADRSRSCRVTDPDDRELTISCGAALQNLAIAAGKYRRDYQIEAFPEVSDPDLLAYFRLGEECDNTLEDNLLFNSIARRRTVRTAFKPDPIPPALLTALEVEATPGAWLHIVHSEDERFELADLIADADRRQWANKSFRLELAAWLHPNKADSRDGMPGYAQGVGDLLSHVEPLAVRTFDLGEGRAAKDRELAIHSPALVVLGTDGDAPIDWLSAGVALSRVLLRACAEDVCASYLNQPLELPETRAEVGRIIRIDGSPQLILRLGFGPDAKPTPRRAVEEVLL